MHQAATQAPKTGTHGLPRRGGYNTNMNIPSKGAAALLAIFFGTLGVHQLYLKRNNVGVPWLILAIVFSWTLFVPFCLGVIGFFQGLSYLFYNKENWEKQFKQ